MLINGGDITGKGERSKPDKDRWVVCSVISIVSKLSLRTVIIAIYNSRELEPEDAACVIQNLLVFQVPNHTLVNDVRPGTPRVRITVYLDESRVNGECLRIETCWLREFSPHPLGFSRLENKI